MPAQSARSFRLNEAVYQLLKHDGDVTVLMLATLRSRAERSLLYLPEVVTERDRVTRELDVAALVDGELFVGEMKSNNKLTPKEVKNSRFVVRNAQAQTMLFATTARAPGPCRAGECAKCIRDHGEHHADRAWNTGARQLIEDTRRALDRENIRVESHCWYTLVGQHADAEQPLHRFRR
jgi:hypothetical protein